MCPLRAPGFLGHTLKAEWPSPSSLSDTRQYHAGAGVTALVGDLELIVTLAEDGTFVESDEGANRLLFKVHNIYGGSILWTRLSDPERQLEVVQPKGP